MPGRKYTQGTSSYRYSINGQEKEKELNENITSAECWEFDSRLGRRWNIDPVLKLYESPYSCFGNNPVRNVDPNGKDSIFYNQAGKEIEKLRIKASGNNAFFVEHNEGNKKINGKTYYQGLTYESLFGDVSYPQKLFEKVDKEWFKSHTYFAEQTDKYTSDTEDRIHFGLESPENHTYDFKNKLLKKPGEDNKHVAYMVDGILLNRNEAGNIYWGAAANKVGWPLGITLFLVHMFTLIDEKTLDNPAEQYAIRWGWQYFEHWRNNTVEGKAAKERQSNAKLNAQPHDYYEHYRPYNN